MAACRPIVVVTLIAASLAAGYATAETPRSKVTFNTGAMQPTGEQPAGGAVLAYPISFVGGELDGCTAQVVETLFPHDDEGWGIFQVAGEATCPDGGFRYASAGAYDANGFHGSGAVAEGSGTGRFDGLAARVAQLGGTITPAATEGTFDVSYELLLDRTSD